MNYQLTDYGVLRLDDRMMIVKDERSLDWQAYLRWAVDHTARPMSPGWQYDWDGAKWVVNPANQAQVDQLKNLGVDLSSVKRDSQIVAFLRMSPAEIDNYINTNITGLNAPSVAAIKTILSVLGKAVSVIARNEIAEQ